MVLEHQAAVDYPSMESPTLLLPDNDPMDLTHLRLTGLARVGQQYCAVKLVPILPNQTCRFLP